MRHTYTPGRLQKYNDEVRQIILRKGRRAPTNAWEIERANGDRLLRMAVRPLVWSDRQALAFLSRELAEATVIKLFVSHAVAREHGIRIVRA